MSLLLISRISWVSEPIDMVKVLTIKGSCAPFLEDKEELSALKSNIPQPLPGSISTSSLDQ